MNQIIRLERDMKLQPFQRFDKKKIMNYINKIFIILKIKTKLSEDILISILKKIINKCCVQKNNYFNISV